MNSNSSLELLSSVCEAGGGCDGCEVGGGGGAVSVGCVGGSCDLVGAVGTCLSTVFSITSYSPPPSGGLTTPLCCGLTTPLCWNLETSSYS